MSFKDLLGHQYRKQMKPVTAWHDKISKHEVKDSS